MRIKKKAKKTEAPRPSVKKRRDEMAVLRELGEAAKELAARKTTSAFRVVELGEELLRMEPVEESDF